MEKKPIPQGIAMVDDAAQAAVVASKQLAETLFPERDETLVHAGKRLAGSISRLQKAVAFYKQQHQTVAPAAPSSDEPGLEEAKLLGLIEKWQLRYQTLEQDHENLQNEYQKLKEWAEELEKENVSLEERHKTLGGTVEQVTSRLDHSINTLDNLLH